MSPNFVALETAATKCLSNPGKHKITSYLYHMTTPANYQKMLESGSIKATKDKLFGNGVFMFEKENFFKRWNKDNSWGNQNLKFSLINHVRKQGADSVILLRVPTENLTASQLKIRSQEALFGRDRGRFTLDKHLLFGANAKDAKTFTRKGQSIEYIYPKDIDISSVEKVGEVNISELQKMSDYNPFKPLNSFFKVLFEGHPEQKAVNPLLNF